MNSPSHDVAHSLRVVFLGTPEFAVPALTALITSPAIAVVLVVTQPDRPSGRGRQLKASAVKEVATAHAIAVLQPERLRGPEVLERLHAADADLFVIAAFGQILRQAVLDIPRYGCLNVHPSLLPRHRGPSPIATAILDGDPVTGMTIMLTDRGMDTGPILVQEQMPLDPQETTASLTPRLAELGATLLLRTIPEWVVGKIAPQRQDDALATATRTFVKDDGAIDWSHSAVAIGRQVRAFNPWPRAYTFDRAKRLLILDAQVAEAGSGDAQAALSGTVVGMSDNGPLVATGDGLLALTEVQPEGRRALAGRDFARANSALIGSKLGTVQGSGDGA
jgi:methionyl-tRNA formyltransferase